MNPDEIKARKEFTAWARLETSDITPLGNIEGTIASLGAILSEESPEALITDTTPTRESATPIAEAIVASRFARIEINRRSLERLIGSPLQAEKLEDTWLQLRIATEPPASSRRIRLRSPDLNGPLFLVSATQVVLTRFSAFIGVVFDLSRASPEEINDLVESHLPGDDGRGLPYANVVDVGQGGMVTVQQRRHPAVPQLFFDFGWPLRSYEKTAPAPLDLHIVGNAPVVLTHWDFDHFAFALKDVRSNTCEWRPWADERTWLVPGVGPDWGHVLPSATGIIWALHLFLEHKLKVWPHDIAGLTTGYVTIAKTVPYSPCKGDPNQHGLFMILHARVSHDAKPAKPVPAILIPGDADYQAIKRALYPGLAAADPFPTGTFDWKGLVATHHGGEFTYAILPSTTVPNDPRHAPKGILAISVSQTHYGHPTALAQQAYLMNGRWCQHTLTYNRRQVRLDCMSVSCRACYCCFQSPAPRGNTELNLGDRRIQRGCPLDWQPFQ